MDNPHASFPEHSVWPLGYVLTDVRMKSTTTDQAPPASSRQRQTLRAVPAKPSKQPRKPKVSAAKLLEQQVDASMELLDTQRVVTPTVLLYITQGSITAAHCLEQIRHMSDGQWDQTGDPWLHLTAGQWADRLMINKDEWVKARALLRSLELIAERSAWDSKAQAIVVEVSFDPDGFSRARSRVREVFRQHILKQRRIERGSTRKDVTELQTGQGRPRSS